MLWLADVAGWVVGEEEEETEDGEATLVCRRESRCVRETMDGRGDRIGAEAEAEADVERTEDWDVLERGRSFGPSFSA